MIPNIFHFIFGMKPDFGGKPFNMVHYLAVRSAAELNKPDRMYLHFQYEPRGEWFEKAKPYLTLNKITAPTSIHGNPLLHVAHQADIVRLNMLKEHGGIYLDLDTISKKPLTSLLAHDFLIAKEFKPPVYYTRWDRVKNAVRQFRLAPLTEIQKVYGLCNAVMLSAPGSRFVEMWLDNYVTFRSRGKDEFWVEHSVKVPYELAQKHPDLLTILEPEAFHYPAYDPKGLAWLFEKTHDYQDAYLHHLWETNAWNYISALTPEIVKDKDTTYNIIARQYLA